MCLLHKMYQLLIALNIIFQYATSLPSDDQSTATIPAPKLGNRCAKLPAMNITSFQTLVEYKCYVDKTQYLSKFILRKQDDGSSNTFFLARPRRFGKSILVDTMFEFFKGNRKLFNNTFIGKNHPDPWTEYPVIRLDFSRGFSVDSVEDFKADLMSKLQEIAHSYQINLKAPCPASGLEELIWKLKDAKKLPVVVLIDEYDSPYCRAYVNDKTVTKSILCTLQSFFSTLKGDDDIHLSFITGVNRIEMTDSFSGYNAETDLTMDLHYPAIVGFTEEELRDYFGDFIKNVATIRKKEATDILKVMEECHGGFQFSSAHARVYCPCSVINFLNSEGTKATDWSETSGSESFLNENLKEFNEIAVRYPLGIQIKNCSAIKVYATELILRGKYYTTKDERSLTALLFQNGYLSIESCEDEHCCLRFSNKELLQDYKERISYLLHSP